jgi:F1F0 ATPase subunit 2
MQLTLSLTLELALAGVAGGLLGAVFFGGLWWTLRRAFASPRPALWVGSSLLLRMACVAVGFIVVSSGDWRRLLACLLGFWATRWLLVRLSTLPTKQPLTAHPVVAERVCSEVTTGSS